MTIERISNWVCLRKIVSYAVLIYTFCMVSYSFLNPYWEVDIPLEGLNMEWTNGKWINKIFHSWRHPKILECEETPLTIELVYPCKFQISAILQMILIPYDEFSRSCANQRRVIPVFWKPNCGSSFRRFYCGYV